MSLSAVRSTLPSPDSFGGQYKKRSFKQSSSKDKISRQIDAILGATGAMINMSICSMIRPSTRFRVEYLCKTRYKRVERALLQVTDQVPSNNTYLAQNIPDPAEDEKPCVDWLRTLGV